MIILYKCMCILKTGQSNVCQVNTKTTYSVVSRLGHKNKPTTFAKFAKCNMSSIPIVEDVIF